MISIDRLEEMTIEELQTKLKNFEEQIKLQNNFIDSLFKATNNSEWLDKSMLDDEVSEVIKKIELDYEQLDQLKAENEELKDKNNRLTILGMDLNQSNEVLRKSFFATDKSRDNWREKAEKLEQTLTEIKEIALGVRNYSNCPSPKDVRFEMDIILGKISEVADVEHD